MSDVYDYVIVGSGMAGLTVASLLARAGNSVCLLEAHEHPGGCAHSFPIGRYTFSRETVAWLALFPFQRKPCATIIVVMLTWPFSFRTIVSEQLAACPPGRSEESMPSRTGLLYRVLRSTDPWPRSFSSIPGSRSRTGAWSTPCR
ncbi:MAG: FAD-dependent oxidoreductase [Isosphaeraceae bacterium]